MDQLTNFADARLLLGCVYCGAREDSREHVPSRVFLDPPFPENLSIIGACRPCNNGFSLDEEYVACLVEVVIAGSTHPDAMRRPGIRRILERSPALRKKLEDAKVDGPSGTSFQPETSRVERVLRKLATGHAAYELAQECREAPQSIWWHPIHLLSPEQQEEFDAPALLTVFGEVGSRGMQRLKVVEIGLVSQSGQETKQHVILNDWVEVQSGRYRYLAADEGGTVFIRMVLGEYLAAEVTWEI